MAIRLRLALWYTGLAGFVLTVVLTAAFLTQRAALNNAVDEQLRSVGHRAALHVQQGLGAGGQVTDGSLQPISAFTDAQIWVRYFDAAGRELAHSPNAEERPVIILALPQGREGRFVDGLDRGEPLRAYVEGVQIGTQPAGFVGAVTSLASIDALNANFALLLGAISFGGLLLTAGAGWAIAGGALRPIRAIILTAQVIAQARGFARRLPAPPRRDELGQLTRTLNEMLDSLEAAYATQRRFVDDAAHELRAPITIIQGNLALFNDPTGLDPAERAEVLADLEAEVQRLSRLVNDLLALARADAGQQGRQAVVELDTVLTTVYQQLRGLAPSVTLRIDALAQVCVRGDVDRLQQLVLILAQNAVRYTLPGGLVELGVGVAERTATLTVRDTGIGIAPADLPHIFERFYRTDAARDLYRDGTGLGLPIARWIAQTHGGTLSVQSQPAAGSTFTVRLPIVACVAVGATAARTPRLPA